MERGGEQALHQVKTVTGMPCACAVRSRRATGRSFSPRERSVEHRALVGRAAERENQRACVQQRRDRQRDPIERRVGRERIGREAADRQRIINLGIGVGEQRGDVPIRPHAQPCQREMRRGGIFASTGQSARPQAPAARASCRCWTHRDLRARSGHHWARCPTRSSQCRPVRSGQRGWERGSNRPAM